MKKAKPGRRKLPESMRRHKMQFTLPIDLRDWLRRQPNQSLIVETALREYRSRLTP